MHHQQQPYYDLTGTTADLWRGHRATLHTFWGTRVYFDTTCGELRHGRFDETPANAVLSPCGSAVAPSDQTLLAVFRDGGIELVASRSDGSVPSSDAPTAFAMIPLNHDQLALKSDGLFLCAEADGRLTLSKTHLQSWETFVVAAPEATNPLRTLLYPPSLAAALEQHRQLGSHRGLVASPKPGLPHGVIICDIGWLRTFIASEHYHLIDFLHEVHGFDIVDSQRANLEDPVLLSRINTYPIVLVTYAWGQRIPMQRFRGYRVFRIDDLQLYNEGDTQEFRRLVRHSDMVISPYAYELARFFPHPNIRWVPYSSAVETEAGDLSFNEEPIARVLVSGSVAADRPFRSYVFGLSDDRVVKLGHPGYGNRYTEESPEIVKRRWYEELRRYLCAFCDAHSLRYIHLRVFEIASVGALLLADRLVEPEMNRLGFVDGDTCLFSDQRDFMTKVDWILDPANRPEVDRIRRNGMRLARSRHTVRTRAAELAELLKQQGTSVQAKGA